MLPYHGHTRILDAIASFIVRISFQKFDMHLRIMGIYTMNF